MIFSLVQGGYLLGVENLGGQRDLVAQLHGERTFEEAVKFAVEENGRTVWKCTWFHSWRTSQVIFFF